MDYPRKLYKYREINAYTLRIFSDDELYYASYRIFDDPFELAFDVSIRRKPGSKVSDSVIDDYRRRIKENIISCFRPEIGFLSLTEVNDDLLMWSHYAAGHRGICLEFDISTFELDFLRKVTYSTDLYCVNCWVDDREEGIHVPVHNDEYIVGICNTKCKEWEYEREWREVRRENGVQKFQPQGLTAVILGCKIDDKDRAQVMEALTQRRKRIGGFPSVRIYEARMRPGKFALDIVDTGEVV